MSQGHPRWEEIIALAERCSWRAGPILAGKMRRNDFLRWERVCAACEDGRAVGFCTFTEKDELPEGLPYSPFIGFVFVEEGYRGRRLSEKMIRRAAAYAGELGYEKVYIMSGEQGLYEKYGFQMLGVFETVYGTADQLFVRPVSPGME